MAISANQIVQVLPRLLTGTGKDLQFNGLVLDKSNLIPVDEVLSFGDAESVGDYFGTLSDEYKFAQIYFGGYTNSQIKPSILNFYRNVKIVPYQMQFCFKIKARQIDLISEVFSKNMNAIF